MHFDNPRRHIKLHGSPFYLCGEHINEVPSDINAVECMQCGMMVYHLLIPSKHYNDIKEALDSLILKEV